MNHICRWLMLSFFLVSSVVILSLGLPRFLYEAALVKGTPIYWRLVDGEWVGEESVAELIDSRLAAIGFLDMPRAHAELGATYLFQAQRAVSVEKRTQYLESALKELTTAVERAPIDSFTWSRIAAAQVMLGKENYAAALKAWRNSVKTARFEPYLLILRIHLGILLYDEFEDSDIELLRNQVALSYEWNRWRTRQYALDNHLIEWMVFLSDPNDKLVDFWTQ